MCFEANMLFLPVLAIFRLGPSHAYRYGPDPSALVIRTEVTDLVIAVGASRQFFFHDIWNRSPTPLFIPFRHHIPSMFHTHNWE